MASSGQISQWFGGTSSNPNLRLFANWEITDRDVAGDRTRVLFDIFLYTRFGVEWNASRTARLEVTGSSFNSDRARGSINLGAGNIDLGKIELYFGNNSDGTDRSLDVRIVFPYNLDYRGISYGNLVASETIVIDAPPPPEPATISSVSPNTNMTEGSAMRVSFDVVKSDPSHWVSYQALLDGTAIRTWSRVALLESFNIEANEINMIIDTMSSSMTRNITFRVTTREGSSSGRLLGVNEKEFQVTLSSSSSKPVLGGTTTLPVGSGRDSSIGSIVQHISRAYVRFDVTNWGRGASRSSVSMSMSNHSFDMEYTSLSSGTREIGRTAAVISTSGSHTVSISATNSRGQTTTSSITFSVRAYGPPNIEIFSAARRASPGTTVDVSRRLTWSGLSGDNNLTVRTTRKAISLSSWTLIHTQTAVSGLITSSISGLTGYTSHISYEFRIEATDQFGNSSIAQFYMPGIDEYISIRRDTGVGVGKRHERGVIDMAGDVYLNGDAFFINGTTTESKHSLSLGANWAKYGSIYGDPGYIKRGDVIHLYGMVRSTTAVSNNDVIMILPIGCRPGQTQPHKGIYNGATTIRRIDLRNNGEVRWYGGNNVNVPWLSLAGITFIAVR